MAMKLESAAFASGGSIPKQYTCDGEDRSPALSWSGVPEGTQSFVLACVDPDAPSGLFHHWAAYDIPASFRGLGAGYGKKSIDPAVRQAVNDFGKPGYGGPCPPRSHKAHHYHFRLSALDVPSLEAPPTAKCTEIIALAREHEIAAAELVGLYGRGQP